MKRLSLTVLLLLLATSCFAGFGMQIIDGSMPVSGGGTCSTDNDSQLVNIVDNGVAASCTETNWRGQAFQHDAAFTCTMLKIRVRDDAQTGTCTIVLAADNEGSPGTELASASLAHGDITDDSGGAEYEFAFSSPETGLSASTTYWWYCKAEGTGAGFSIFRDSGNPYAGGISAVSVSSGGAWTKGSTYDLQSEVWGCED